MNGTQYRNRRIFRALLAAPFRRTTRKHKDKAERSTPRFARFTDRALADMAMRIHKSIKAIIKRSQKQAMAEAKKAFPAELAFEPVELADPEKELEAAIREWMTQNFKTGMDATIPELEEMGVRVDWGALAKDGIEFLANYSLKLAEKITADAEFELRYTIMDALMKGKGAQGMATEIRKMGDDYYDRAEIIARTEGMRALNQGRLNTYQDAGVEEVAWIASDLACPECRPLDGKIYKMGEQPEIPLHPNCFLEGTPIHGALSGGIVASLRSLYSGMAFELITASGHRLQVTADHPIATPTGFRPAKLLHEGAYVLSYSGGLEIIEDHNDQNGPPVIEQVFEMAARFGRPARMPASAPDLHCYFLPGKGKVDIADAESILGDDRAARCAQFLQQGSFVSAYPMPHLHPGLSPANLLGPGHDPPTGRYMGGGYLMEPGRGRHLLPLEAFRLRPAPHVDIMFSENPGDNMASDAMLLRQLLQRNPASIFLDQLVSVRAFPFSGHVYDLQTATHIIVGGHILTHNCRCTIGAVTEFTNRTGDRVNWGD